MSVIDALARELGGFEPDDPIEEVDRLKADAVVRALSRAAAHVPVIDAWPVSWETARGVESEAWR